MFRRSPLRALRPGRGWPGRGQDYGDSAFILTWRIDEINDVKMAFSALEP